jgi:hypothetical protein
MVYSSVFVVNSEPPKRAGRCQLDLFRQLYSLWLAVGLCVSSLRWAIVVSPMRYVSVVLFCLRRQQDLP